MLSQDQLSDKIESKKDAIEDAIDQLQYTVDEVDFDRDATVRLADFESVVAVAAQAQGILVLVNELGALKNVFKAGQRRERDGRFRRQR